MFAHPPHLLIRRPSPTTTEFVVTTSPPRSLLTSVLLTARILLLLALAAFLCLAPAPSVAYRLPISLAGAYLLLLRWTTQESLLVIEQLGIQTSSTAGTLWGQRPKTRFIPAEEVLGLWINEGFIGFTVRFYLCVAVKGEKGLVVVFPTLLPRRALLERVWRGVGGCV